MLTVKLKIRNDNFVGKDSGSDDFNIRNIDLEFCNHGLSGVYIQ